MIARKQKAGLTLIEVLLAIMILGFSMTVLIAGATRCLAVARKVRVLDTTRELLARVELEHPLQLEEKIEDAAGSGTFNYPDDKYRWQRDVTPVGLEKDGLFEIRTAVKWSERDKESSEEVVTLLQVPKDKRRFSLE